ncbi:MAG: ABC transporter ATP-binding protein [Chitinophagales bacterium]|nr:ABC transporter ATP-binding protein [Chitinophagales bacterium]
MSEEKKGSKISFELFKKLLGLAKPYKKWFFMATFLSILISCIGPLRPYLIQQMIDINIIQNRGEGIEKMIAILLGLLLVESVLRYFFIYLTSLFGQFIIKDLRMAVFKKIVHFRMKFFDTTPIGTSTTRTISDVETINDIYSDNFFTIISDILTILIVLSLMFYKNWQLTLVSLIPFPVLIWLTANFKNKVKVTFNKVREKVSEMNAFLQEHISGVKITQIFHAEEKEASKFDKINVEHRQANIEAIWHYSVFFPALELVLAVSLGFMVCFASYKSFGASRFSIGEIAAFFLYMNMIFRPMRFLADKFNTLQMGIVSSERVFKILESDETATDSGTYKPTQVRGDIAFEHVYFEYNEGVPVLRDINFTIQRGQTLAIVGATGSGKTSIISILCRFYDIQKGAITLDGRSIYDYELNHLRSRISLVLQDVFLFSGSIYDNIALYNPEITIDKVKEAAKELEIHDFIMSLPGDYYYDVKERGATLSLGQRQLISFIRALIANPTILILDEATSSVDTQTEQIIQNAIAKLIKGRTTIIIAHRMSTIVHANKILVLDKGTVSDIGNHKELLDRNPVYQNYFFE